MLKPAIDEAASSAAELAIFLDLDGTLVPIATRPDEIVVDRTTIDLLDQLHRNTDGALAVISGRPVDKLRCFLAPVTVPLAGSHGLELSLPGEPVMRRPIDEEALQKADQRLCRFAQSDGRLIVERKSCSVALHYRQAPDRKASCERLMQDILNAFPMLKLIAGKMVLELTAGEGDKANAIKQLMQRPPFAGRVPLFAGDDATDESAFPVVQELGGLTIKVGTGETSARFRFADVEAFLRWLKTLSGRLDAAKISHQPETAVS
ncbi:trehalose-phosphatase [Pararhizobium haloflavum]|uniref:trehalose-phosphatase n=1 Tax=Pararhizobium haloflavum TaxID=2037914 RepID=UPI000C17887D|nr:trehalose-phosphatase [Pararhizobium haloflavum]